MIRRILKNIGHVAAVFFVVTIGLQFLLDLIPGSPAQIILGEGATPEDLAEVNARFGFDDPFPVRYVNWLGDLFDGSFGTSYRTRLPVRDAISGSAALSAELALGAMALALIVSIPLALATASRQGGLLDRITTMVTSVLISIPSFLLSILLLYLFAVNLGWFEVVTPWVPLTEDPLANLKIVTLPILALAIPEIVIFTRVLRSDVLSTLQQDFMLAAKAKGLSRRYLLARHALRPSSLSLMTVAGLSLGRLFGGAIIAESIFSLPGLGRVLVTAIEARDLPTVMGIAAFVAVLYTILNAVIDVGYGFVDPRARL